MKITASTKINAPISKVFEVFTNLETAQKHISGITKIELLQGENKMAVGTKWQEARVMFGKESTEEMWVTELEQNKMYVVEADSMGTKYRTEFIFEEVDGQTNVNMIFEGKPYSLSARAMSIVAFAFMGATKKALQKDLDELKQVCETS